MPIKRELSELKEALAKHIAVLQSELGTVEKTLQIIERESPTARPPNDHFRNVGLSDACRQIIQYEWISPADVRDIMMRGGFKSDNAPKLLGYVFATLKRLVTKGELEAKKVDGKMKYRVRPVSPKPR